MAAVRPLSREVARLGLAVMLAGPIRGDDASVTAQHDGVSVVAHRSWRTGMRSVAEAWAAQSVVASLAQEKPPRIVHVHGVWTSANIAACRRARSLGVPYVVSPHGMLMPLAMGRSNFKKRWALWAAVRRNLEGAAVVHVTSEAEKNAVYAVAPSAQTRVIPWGVDVREPPAQALGRSNRIAACIGRILPLKGVGDLVDAWAEARPAGWELRFIGPDPEGYGRELNTQIEQRGLRDAVSIHPALDHESMLRMIDTIDLLVLPSHSENFGMVVAEALAAGVPVVTTTATPWHAVVERQAGWCVPDAVPALAAALRDACGRGSADLEAMGSRGRKWMRDSFSWPAIARRFYEEIYQTIS